MKILCKVHGKNALIVGFCQGHKSKVTAIVISDGQMKGVALKDIELLDLPEQISGKEPIPLKKKAGAG